MVASMFFIQARSDFRTCTEDPVGPPGLQDCRTGRILGGPHLIRVTRDRAHGLVLIETDEPHCFGDVSRNPKPNPSEGSDPLSNCVIL
jgi:hypothetical protein